MVLIILELLLDGGIIQMIIKISTECDRWAISNPAGISNAGVKSAVFCLVSEHETL